MRLVLLLSVICGLTIFVAPHVLRAEIGVTVTTVDGNPVLGTLVRIDDDSITISTNQNERRLSLEQVQRLVFATKKESAIPFAKVILNDGSQLHCRSLTIKNGLATCNTVAGEASIATSHINYVRLAPYRSGVDNQWKEVLAGERNSDQVVVRRQNNVIDYLDGVLGDMTKDHIEFQFDGDLIDVKLTRIDGMIFFHKSESKFARPSCSVTLVDGSVLAGDSISIADTASVTTLSGQSFDISRDAICEITFTNRRAVYLSDIDPERYQWQSPITKTSSEELVAFFQPRRDRGFGSEELAISVNGSRREFRKGISAIGQTELTYRLAGEFRSFQALVGTDATIDSHGEALLEIWVDSKRVFTRKIDGAEGPVPVEIDLSGVGRMRIVVTSGEIIGDGDYVSLCDARLMK